VHAQAGNVARARAEGCDVRHVACHVVARPGAELDAQHDSRPASLSQNGSICGASSGQGKPWRLSESTLEVEAAKLEHVEGMVDLGKLLGLPRHRVVDMHQAGHPPGILPLGEGVSSRSSLRTRRLPAGGSDRRRRFIIWASISSGGAVNSCMLAGMYWTP